GFHQEESCVDMRSLLGPDGTGFLGYGMVDRLRRLVEEVFEEPLDRSHAQVVAHRMTPGDFIGRHNDMPVGRTETHRVILCIESESLEGGELVLGDGGATKSITASFGLVLAFPLSARSFHEVRPIVHGTRVTLIFSFWSAAASASGRLLPHARL